MEEKINRLAESMLLKVLTNEMKRTGLSTHNWWLSGDPKDVIKKELVKDVKETCLHIAALWYEE